APRARRRERQRPVVEEPLRELFAAEAAHARALAGAAEIPADEVEPPLEDDVQPLAVVLHPVERAAPTTGVPEQGADAALGLARQVADYRQRDLAPVRMTPAQRNPHPGALDALTATSPGDPRLGGLF